MSQDPIQASNASSGNVTQAATAPNPLATKASSRSALAGVQLDNAPVKAAPKARLKRAAVLDEDNESALDQEPKLGLDQQQVAQANIQNASVGALPESADPLAVGALPQDVLSPWLAQGGSGIGAVGRLAALPLLALGGGGGGGTTPAPIAKSLTGKLAEKSDSGKIGDNTTNDSTPTMTGVATPGATVLVAIDTNNDGVGDVTFTAVADALGNWSATSSATLPDGTFVVTITARDTAGSASTPVSMPLIIDSSARAPSGGLSSDSGTAAVGDALSSDTTPTIVGIGSPGDAITMVIAGQTLTTQVGPDGKWSVTLNSALPDGPYTAVVTSVDAAGNVSAPSYVPFAVDTSVPVTSALDAASDTGVAVDNLTNDNTPTILGTGDPGDAITVTTPTGEVLTAVVAADGTWSVTPNVALLDGGPQNFSVIATDPAGNVSAPVVVPVTVDTMAPAAQIAALDPASDAGIVGDDLTNDSTPTISGTGNPGDTITVTTPTGEVLTGVVAADGSWSVTPTVALPDGGPQNISVTATDPAGNVSPAAFVQVTIDTGLPTLTAALNPVADSSNPADSITSDTTPSIKGTGDPGQTVTVTSPTGEVLTAIVAADGTWSVTPTVALPEGGPQNFTVSTTDAAGNTIQATVLVTIDSIAASAPLVSLATDANNDLFINAAEIGSATTVNFNITLPAQAKEGDTIQLFNGTTTQNIVLTAAHVAAGTVAAAVARPAEGATLTVTAKLIDIAGNESPTGSDAARLDTTALAAPTVTILEDANNNGLISGSELTGAIDVRVGLPLGAAVGDTVVVTDNAGNSRSVTLTAALITAGSVSVAFPAPAQGATFVVTASVTDLAGNPGAVSTADSAVIDTVAPVAPVAVLAPSSDSGVAGDSRTNDSTPSISGTGIPGDLITVTSPTGESRTAVVAANGTWSVTPLNALPEGGPQIFSVTATDPSGNVSPPVTIAVTIDRTAPTVLTARLDPSSDTGVTGDSKTNDTTPTISGTGEVGARISVVVAGQTLTTTVQPDGTWSVTPTTLLDGPYTATVTETDAAGNTLTGSAAFQIDTSPAITTLVINSITADNVMNIAEGAASVTVTGTVTGEFQAGNIVTLTINGNTFTGSVNAAGTFSINVPGTALLADSNLTVDASLAAYDNAGNLSTITDTQLYTKDTVAPAPVISVNSVTADNVINIAEGAAPVPITGTITGDFEAGDTVTLTVNGVSYTGTVDAAGNYNIAVPGAALLADPDRVIDLRISTTDAAGNSATVTSTRSYTTDTTAPTPLTVDVDAASDSGISNADNITNDTTPTISGTGEAGARITVTMPGTGEVLTTTVAANGTWSVTPTQALNNSANQVVAITQTDAAGNTSTGTTTVSIDTKAPVSSSLAAATEDLLASADLRTLDEGPGYVSGLATAQILSLPTHGTLYLAGGVTAVAVGQTLSASELAGLQYLSGTHVATNVSFGVLATDVAGNAATVTVTRAVTAVADADVLEVASPTPEIVPLLASSTGLTRIVYDQSLDLDAIAPTTSANGFLATPILTAIEGVMDTTRVARTTSTVTSLSEAAHVGTNMVKFTGLIYLTAGTYVVSTNNVSIDETIKVNLGGNTVLASDLASAAFTQTPLTVNENGYYSLDAYFVNAAGSGVLPAIHLAKDGGTPMAVNTANFRLFRNAAEVESAVIAAGGNGLNGLEGSLDGVNGFYTVKSEGKGSAGDTITLLDINLAPADHTDGSETNTVVISGVPIGTTLISGTNSFTATAGSQSVDATGWNLTTMVLAVPKLTAPGTHELVVTSTSVEASNSDTATSVARVPVKIALNTSTYTGSTGDDTGANTIEAANGGNRMFGGGGSDQMRGGLSDDILYGGSGGLVRNGGFEYWNIEETNAILGGAGFEFMALAADTVYSDGDGALGGWITGGAAYQGSQTQNIVELLRDSAPISGIGRFVLDLSADEVHHDLHIAQKITTIPDTDYQLDVAVRSGIHDDIVNVMWGDVVIARIAGDAANTVTTYHGYAAPIVTTVTQIDGTGSSFKNYQFTVRGSVDSDTTTVAIQTDATGGALSQVRELLYVKLTPTVVDGNDTIEGFLGSDVLFGQEGNDILYGGVNGDAAADAGSTDIAVFSFANNNGHDVFQDFEVGTDKLYVVDVVDAYIGSGNWASSGDQQHLSRYPGNFGSTDVNSTSSSDNNLTLRDFTYANDAGTTATALGQRSQYLTVSANANGDLVIHFNTNGGAVGGTNSNLGSVTLTGVKFGSSAGQYDSVADLFGGGGSTQLLWATTDGFKEPYTTRVFDGQTVQDFDWTQMTNITRSGIVL